MELFDAASRLSSLSESPLELQLIKFHWSPETLRKSATVQSIKALMSALSYDEEPELLERAQWKRKIRAKSNKIFRENEWDGENCLKMIRVRGCFADCEIISSRVGSGRWFKNKRRKSLIFAREKTRSRGKEKRFQDKQVASVWRLIRFIITLCASTSRFKFDFGYIQAWESWRKRRPRPRRSSTVRSRWESLRITWVSSVDSSGLRRN